MINLHVSIGNEETEEWESFKTIVLKESDDSYGIDEKILSLPNGEELKLALIISPSNLGMSFVIKSKEVTLLNIGCFKQSMEGYDPSVVYFTPQGTHLSFMFGE